MKKTLSVLFVSMLAFASVADDCKGKKNECPLMPGCEKECAKEMMMQKPFGGSVQLECVLCDTEFLTNIGLDGTTISKIKDALVAIKQKEVSLLSKRKELFKEKTQALSGLSDRSNDGSAIKEINTKIKEITCELDNLQVDKMLIVRDNTTDEQYQAIRKKVSPKVNRKKLDGDRKRNFKDGKKGKNKRDKKD